MANMPPIMAPSVSIGYRIKYEVIEPIFAAELGPTAPDAVFVERLAEWSWFGEDKARRSFSRILYPIPTAPGLHRADLLALLRVVNRRTPDEYAEEFVENETDEKAKKYILEQFGPALKESDLVFSVVKNVPYRK
ncbi:hypothetical protein H0H93_006706 [Arthromyces matolae]|nr:hypothetical protein H0H93_006706 [Arthromyces matolae]